jgi:LysW-gamma-L-lysine carboxypeptidase
LIVIGAVEEESDSRGAWHVVRQYRPDLAIIGEPSGWNRVAIGYRGSLWFEYSTRRAMSHTASNNKSACEAAVDFWNRLQAYCDQYNVTRARVFEQLSPTLRAMRSRNDGFEETAFMQIGVRLPLGISIEQWWKTLDGLRGDDDIFTVGAPVPAYRADKNTPLVRAFLAAIRAQGEQPGFVLKSGTADMNTVGPIWNCPSVAYGPGDSNLDHTPQEHLWLTEYHKAVTVLIHTLRSLS